MNSASYERLKMTLVAKSIIVLVVTMGVVLLNVPLHSRVSAESGQGNDVFKVVVSLFGVSNSTKDVVTVVNVGDQTKVKLFNAENPESEGEDTVSYTMTFPGVEVQDGEPYTVCTMTVEGFKMKCDKGNNSPLNRPEFVDVNIGGGSSSEDKDKDDD